MTATTKRLRLAVIDIFTSGMYEKCEPAVLYKFMMLNLVLIVGTPFVLGFGLFDLSRHVQPLGSVITIAGLTCAWCFYFLRKTKNYAFVGYFLIFILFWMFLYLLATGGSHNSGLLWYYSFTPIALFLLGFRMGSALVLFSLTLSAVILFWPGAPFLFTVYETDVKIRFIPSVIVLWAITSLFEHVKAVALKIEIKNNELKDTVEELRQAREALSSEKERLTVTLRSIGDAVVAADINNKVMLMNKVAENLTGWLQEEAAGRDVEEIVKITGRRSESRQNQGIKEGDLFSAMKYRVLTDRQGQQRIISDAEAPIFDKQGQMIGAVLVFRDVTEQVRMEEDLYRTSKLESVGLLAGGIAHDFNNILTTIKGAVYILSKNIDNNSPLVKYPDKILSSIKKGTDLAQSLLAFSRKQTITAIPLDLNELINDSLTLLRRLMGERIDIVMSLDEGRPVILGDKNQIQQILMNLSANARDAMPEGGRLDIRTSLVEISESMKGQIGAEIAGPHVLLEIEDTGSGIGENIREKIFEPFFTTKELGQGSGLGLSVTYGIVKQHNGLIDFESAPNKSTVFIIYFPALKDSAAGSLRQESVSSGRPTDPKTILLAEDDRSARDMMKDLLSMEGYSVIDAKDGEEAVRLFLINSAKVDLALVDVRMPGKNGKEVYDEIKRTSPETPVLFMSGYTEDIIDSDGILKEGLNFIPKSSTPEELLEKIRQLI